MFFKTEILAMFSKCNCTNILWINNLSSFKFLLQYIKNNDFKAFGYYRIVLGLIVIAYLFLVGDPTLQ